MASESKARDREMSTGLLRQRRNLMGISILLPLYLASGATFKNISILGTSIELENPKIITSFLVILFFYFLLRYWQYFNEERHVQYSKQDLKRVQDRYIRKYVKDKINKTFKNMNDSYIKRISYLDMDHEITYLKSNKILSQLIEVNLTLNAEEVKNKNDFLNINKKWKIVNEDSTAIYNSAPNEKYVSEVSISSILIFYQNVKGFLKFIFTNSLFTDYYLPIIIWLVSFVYLFLKYINKI